MEAMLDNFASGKGYLLWANPLWLQEGVLRPMQMLQSKLKMYSFVQLWWKLPVNIFFFLIYFAHIIYLFTLIDVIC